MNAPLTTTPFHAARWNEPLVMDLDEEGACGLMAPAVDPAIAEAAGDVLAGVPDGVARKAPPALPRITQHRVMRHFTRLSQMSMGFDVTTDMMGTCTMKYSPRVHEHIARLPDLAEVHPNQPEATQQGILEILHRFERMMCAIAGMDAFSFQPASGAQGIYTNACIIRAYHASRGEADQRDEIITTAFSHPADAATPSVAGFKVITLMPGEMGYPDVDALKAALSDRTAGLMLTNPEDTGLFNSQIKNFVDLVHQAGGLCAYDQANGNPLLGIARAGDAGFDLCQFNLHKTFSAPHSGIGQGCAAVGVRRHLEPFLPGPVVVEDGDGYRLDHDRPQAIEKIRGFLGNVHTVMKAYAWVMSLGADGLRAVAETAVLNNNYLAAGLSKIRGVTLPWPANNKPRLDQVRYSWEKLHEETGVSTFEILVRMVDFGVQHYLPSHVPMLVPQPFTLEPGESLTIEELDRMIAIMTAIAEEAYTTPEIVRSAPHNTAVGQLDLSVPEDPACWAFTHRALLRKEPAWSSPDRVKRGAHEGGY